MNTEQGKHNKRHSRRRKKTLAVLAVLLVLSSGVSWWMIHTGQMRQEFVSMADPVSGYRCRMTVASNWQRDLPAQKQSGDNDVLLAKEAPSPIKQWIDTHVFHRPIAESACIYLNHSSLKGDPGSFQVIAGYPESPPGSQEPLVHKHFFIGRCPTTLFQSQITQGGVPYSLTVLFVYVPDAAMVFTLFGDAEVAHAGSLDREVQAIIASFHVEKAGRTSQSGKP